MAVVGDPIEELRKKYCPPLDETLLLALASDFDLRDDDQNLVLEGMLQGLRNEAEIEQQMELAAPIPQQGSNVDNAIFAIDTQIASSTNGRNDMVDNTDRLANITNDLSNTRTSCSADGSTATTQSFDYSNLGLEHSTMKEKEEYLAALFPSLERVQVAETVTKSHGDVQQSIDELLNLSFISEDITKVNGTPVPITKGVDGFMGDGKTRKAKKGKTRKQKQGTHRSEYGHTSGASTPATNVWLSAAEDMDFITSRTQVSPETAKKIYDETNHNIASTIRKLVNDQAEKHKQQIIDNEVLGIQAAELKFSFPNLPDKYLFGSLLLCQMQPSAAKDILDAMLSQPSQNEDQLRPGTKLSDMAQYTPLILTDDEDSNSAHKSRMPGVSTVSGDTVTLMSRAAMQNIQAQKAFSSASVSARMAKSNYLYGGASAYYASVGHEARARSRMLQAAAADSFAAAHTTSTSLDLHGVSVVDAMRIAQRNVEAWWEGLGDSKYVRGGTGNGYRIIVGVGTHSDKGIGRLGPAVSKMLIREGWKVNVQRGEVIVEGKLRR